MIRRIEYRPLGGADYFILALDHNMRRAGMHGNICRVFVDLDGTVEAEQLRSAIRASGLSDWLAKAHIGRKLPFLGPVWRCGSGQGNVVIGEQVISANWGYEEDLPPLERHQDLRPDVPPNVLFELMHRPDKTTVLVMSWQHALMDAHGAELLLRHIDAAQAGTPPAEHSVLGNGKLALPDRVSAWLRLLVKVREARRSLFLVDEVSRPPVASIQPVDRGAVGSRNCFRLIPFGREDADLISARVEQTGATFARTVFYLAVSMCALHALLTERSVGAPAFLVPVPHERRKAGASGPVFSNKISFLFYRGEPEDMGSLERLATSLLRQMKSQVRGGIPGSFEKAMEMFRCLPLDLYSRMLHGPSGGQLASFFFSDTGESFRNNRTFLGAQIRNVIHLPPVPFPPGVAIVTGQFDGQMNIVLSWVEGCLDSSEVDLLERTIRALMLGEEAR